MGEFYDKLATAADLPETAAPSPGAFEAAFRRQAEAGADQVVHQPVVRAVGHHPVGPERRLRRG